MPFGHFFGVYVCIDRIFFSNDRVSLKMKYFVPCGFLCDSHISYVKNHRSACHCAYPPATEVPGTLKKDLGVFFIHFSPSSLPPFRGFSVFPLEAQNDLRHIATACKLQGSTANFFLILVPINLQICNISICFQYHRLCISILMLFQNYACKNPKKT